MPKSMAAPASIKDREQRQRHIANQFRKSSPALSLGFLGAANMECLLSSLFNREFMNGNYNWFTAFFSNFVLNADRPFHLFDSKVASVISMPGLHRKCNTVFIVTLSYNGRLTFLVTADKKILPEDKDARHFLDCIMDEFKACEAKKNASKTQQSY